MMMTPLDYYLDAQARGVIKEDAEQLRVMHALQLVYKALMDENQKRARFLSHFRKPVSASGIYLWGGVGIGKTFMMDCFYASIPSKKKMRMHFHQFMQFIHDNLQQHKGQKNPLALVAKSIAKSTMLICLDEFIVKDIVDAMMLARLLESLFEQGITIVTTSNTEPDELYKRGLQRESFLPAIALIKAKLTVIHMLSLQDYRLTHFKSAGIYYTPDDQQAMQQMEKMFALLSHHQEINSKPITINDRHIAIVKEADDVIWFNFNVICKQPRSQHDYLELAKKYQYVLISHVPRIPAPAKDMIILFIRMIDVFYDSRVKLIMSAAEQLDKLYTEGFMLPEYKRTLSRLIEMQSERYFTERWD